MSFEFRRLRDLGNQINVPIPRDAQGFLGRECPNQECLGYFKVKPGTGLSNTTTCHCPYCGHTGDQKTFWTPAQIEYARSVAFGKIADAIHEDLKQMETGPRSLIQITVKRGKGIPIRHYQERSLETHLTCSNCTLEYAVYGVFAFCPDCREHNSLQLLENNLTIADKQLGLAATTADVELQRQLIEDALENCVSAFDGFAREACRLRASKSKDTEKAADLSFQHLPKVADRLDYLFGFRFDRSLGSTEWHQAHVGFMKRHLLAHKAGVVDAKYLAETGDRGTELGRRITVAPDEVRTLLPLLRQLGASLVAQLPTL